MKSALGLVEQAIGGPLHPKPRKPRKNPHAVALGRKGGKIGGVVRAERLSPERRQDIARLAAKSRWTKKT
jgi:hypothetical protein